MKEKFKCWVEGVNDAEGGEEISEYPADYAAEKHAEHYHDGCAEYPDNTVVCVMDENGKVSKFSVTWETTRVYYSKEIIAPAVTPEAPR